MLDVCLPDTPAKRVEAFNVLNDVTGAGWNLSDLGMNRITVMIQVVFQTWMKLKD